ncbi:hypothetical protein AAF712_016034 [Marasmius tenuissimus]|uniref:Uncharacterized protein n=1 Tax=Marasmius tenuissimus TaxID=585030 RepID=A0ABR2ZA32_9AGAR
MTQSTEYSVEEYSAAELKVFDQVMEENRASGRCSTPIDTGSAATVTQQSSLSPWKRCLNLREGAPSGLRRVAEERARSAAEEQAQAATEDVPHTVVHHPPHHQLSESPGPFGAHPAMYTHPPHHLHSESPSAIASHPPHNYRQSASPGPYTAHPGVQPGFLLNSPNTGDQLTYLAPHHGPQSHHGPQPMNMNGGYSYHPHPQPYLQSYRYVQPYNPQNSMLPPHGAATPVPPMGLTSVSQLTPTQQDPGATSLPPVSPMTSTVSAPPTTPTVMPELIPPSVTATSPDISLSSQAPTTADPSPPSRAPVSLTPASAALPSTSQVSGSATDIPAPDEATSDSDDGVEEDPMLGSKGLPGLNEVGEEPPKVRGLRQNGQEIR